MKLEASLHRFTTLCQRLSLQLSVEDEYARLRAAYDQPPRAYHNLSHISDCLQKFVAARTNFDDADCAEFALWYHDAIYDSTAKDNEERSAELAVAALKSGGASSERIERVNKLILATRHREIPLDDDAQWIVDIDLSILGADTVTFTAYDQAIRQEYAWVPESDYRKGRTSVLRGFLNRRRIFQTEYFFERCEHSARENIVRTIEVLK